MIGLNQDQDFDLPKRYAARRVLPGSSATPASSGPIPITAAFGVRFPPEVMLIGPDGRLVARDLKGPEIKQAVAKALGQASDIDLFIRFHNPSLLAAEFPSKFEFLKSWARDPAPQRPSEFLRLLSGNGLEKASGDHGR